ncbi:MAG TPA: nuclear transport factor 2 family protein [Pseudomonadales bacterium]|nr:nuclear transport factor 2 family protein [Pseudomonadales bacterium]
MSTTAELARAYLAWINDRPSERADVGRALLAPDFVWTERPTRFGDRGRSGDANVLLQALADADRMIEDERIVERTLFVSDQVAVMEVEWSGRLRRGGTVLRADGVMILETEDGRIRAARDYLCFDDPQG